MPSAQVPGEHPLLSPAQDPPPPNPTRGRRPSPPPLATEDSPARCSAAASLSSTRITAWTDSSSRSPCLLLHRRLTAPSLPRARPLPFIRHTAHLLAHVRPAPSRSTGNERHAGAYAPAGRPTCSRSLPWPAGRAGQSCRAGLRRMVVQQRRWCAVRWLRLLHVIDLAQILDLEGVLRPHLLALLLVSILFY
jgi:hypothetical protein